LPESARTLRQTPRQDVDGVGLVARIDRPQHEASHG
jgi:hypothetical protein